MNERIKELAKQADEGYTGNSEYDMGDALVGNDAIKKFAELIIRKCVAICQDIDGEDSQDGRCARQDCAVEIREHFGIE